jgi:hypothetical protein
LLTDSTMSKLPRLKLSVKGVLSCVVMLINNNCGHNYINIAQHEQYGQQQVYQ